MDAATLANAMLNRAGVNYAQWVAGVNQAMILGGITNVNRAAMFLAQCGAESGGLEWMTELADGSEYEGRADLGNTQPGDGPRFKGRGPIQITGRTNYLQVSQWAHAKGIVPTADYFIQHPEQLASPQYVWLGPVWYWTVARPNLNALSDARDINGATRAINGGLNGIEGRIQRWTHCLGLGAAILPTGEGPASSSGTPLQKDWFDMATALDLNLEVQRGLLATLKGTGNSHVTNAQAQALHQAFVNAVRAAAASTHARYVRFNGAANPNAVYVVLGGNIAWLTPHNWAVQTQANGGIQPFVEVLDTQAPEYRLPILPGTSDPRK